MSSARVNSNAWIVSFLLRRFILSGIAILFLWVPLASILPGRSIIGNALLLQSYGQLFAVVFVNMLASVFLIAVLRALNDHYQEEGETLWHRIFGDGRSSWNTRLWCIAIVMAVTTPIWLCVFHQSEFAGDWHACLSVIAVASGLVFGSAFLFALAWLKGKLVGSIAGTEDYFPFEDRNQRGLLGGWIRIQLSYWSRWDIRNADLQLASYVVILGLCHFFLMRGLVLPNAIFVSVPLAVVFLIWIATMLLTGIAYRLDKWRLPTTIALIAVLLLSRNFPGLARPSTFPTRPITAEYRTKLEWKSIRDEERKATLLELDRRGAVESASRALEDYLWTAVQNRVNKSSQKSKTLVVVTCPGGGIHAAAWCSFVLDSLCNKYKDFKDSIAIVSGVSGGGVGALCFLDQQYCALKANADAPSRTTGLRTAETHAIPSFNLATQSSLESIAVGLMTDDLYGMFVPRLSWRDRGQRLEDSLQSRLSSLSNQGGNLEEWGIAASKGEMPVIIWNTTDAASGRRVLFDSLPTPSRLSTIGLTSRPINYRELLQDKTDVMPATAARLSASFPYVSPFVRPDHATVLGNTVAIGDGGYVDNEGIVTAVDWIDFLLRTQSLESAEETRAQAFERILLIRIIPSSDTDDLVPRDRPWLVRGLRWLTGPAEAMVQVRSASQSERGNMETDLVSATPSPSDSNVKTTTTVIPTNKVRDEGAKARLSEFLKSREQSIVTDDTPLSTEKRRESSNSNNHDDNKVVVLEIPFELPNSNDVTIPLSWKLSRSQMQWYHDAWRHNEDKNQYMNEVFGRYFTTSEPR